MAAVCEVFTDGDWVESKDQSPHGIRLIQTGNIGEGVFKDRDDKARYISEDTFRRLRCTEVLTGDCLISRLPAPVGRSCLVPGMSTRMITAVDCTIARVNTDQVVPAFFGYYSQTIDYLKAVEARTTGTTRKRISRSALGQVLAPVPLLAEQHRIVGVLNDAFGSIVAARETAEKNLRNAHAIFDGHLQSCFAECADMWPENKLGEVCRTGSGGTPLRSRKEYYEGGTIPWVLSGEVGQGEVRESGHFITEAGLQASSAKIFPANTVLVAMYGATAGEVGILHFAAATNQAVCGVFPSADYDPLFLFFLLLSQKDRLVAQAAGNAQPNISQAKIRNTPVPALPLSDQRTIVGRLGALQGETSLLESVLRRKLAALAELKQSLLQRAFAGEL